MIIGIDLGTTNSLVAAWREGKAYVIPNSLGAFLTPSVVSVAEDGSILTGQAARERLSTHPQASAAEFKRYMGTDKTFLLGGKQFRPEELSALIIRALRADAEAWLGEPVSEAVITVPAYFSDAQRKATKVAGELAGLKVERLLNEPTAAAMAYGLHGRGEESKYLVFDLGGGTFDVSILELFENLMEVHASAGDNQLGGADFTEALADWFVNQIRADLGMAKHVELPAELVGRIRGQAEKAKKEIGERGKTEMTIHWKEQAVTRTIDESSFESLVQSLIDRLAGPIRQALRDARLMVSDIDEIVMVGGATRMPVVRKLATRLFQRFPATDVDPDQVVALGAAVQAGLKMRDQDLKDIVLTDVCPYSLGVAVAAQEGGVFFEPIIERNCYVPVSRMKTFVAAHPRQERVNLRVFQGEHARLEQNVFLGALEVPLPRNVGDQAPDIDVRFTYDINGILEVSVKVEGDDQEHTLVIEENPGVMSREEIQQRLKELAELKIHPRDKLPNVTLLGRAERLHAETLGETRAEVLKLIVWFTQVLDRQDERELEHARARMNASLDQIEGAYRF